MKDLIYQITDRGCELSPGECKARKGGSEPKVLPRGGNKWGDSGTLVRVTYSEMGSKISQKSWSSESEIVKYREVTLIITSMS